MSEPAQATPLVHLLDRDSPSSAPAAVDLLRRAGLRQEVVALGDGPHVDGLTRSGIDFERVPLGGRCEPFRSLPLGRWLSRRLTSREPPILHAHGVRAARCAAAAGLLRPALRPIAMLVEVSRRPTDRQLAWLVRCVGRRPIRLAVRSQALADIAMTAGLDAACVTVVPPMASADHLGQADRRQVRQAIGLTEQDGPVILAAGWCRRQDDQKLVLWAGAILSLLTPNLRVVVPGDGPAAQSLARWIDQAGFAHIARFTGRQLGWAELVGSTDLMVLAGAEQDPTPVAWAFCGRLPVVAVGSAASLARDGQAAAICPTRTPRELAVRIRQVIENPALACRLADVAGREAQDRFSPANVLAAYRALYERLGAKHPQQAGTA